MARSSKGAGAGRQSNVRTRNTSVQATARSLTIAKRGIVNGADFTACMSALMSDLLMERVPIAVGNAVCNAGRNMLAAVALQMRVSGGMRRTTTRRQVFEITPPPAK
jgi:hypothetical protein